MALICIYLFLKYFDTKSWKILAGILILSILSGACDRLFFICFSIPVSLVVIVLYFFYIDKKTLAKFLVTILIGAFLAIILWTFFKNNPYFTLTKAYGEMKMENISSSWAIFSKQMYGYITTPSFIMFLTHLSICSYIATAIYVIRKTLKYIREKKYADKMFLFQLFVLFFTPIVLAAPILSGSYGGFDTMRYNYFPFLLLPFNAVILVSNLLNRKKIIRIITNTILSVFFIGYLLMHYPVREFGKGLERFFNFYPEKVKTIDGFFAEDNTYKYGITNDYWMAKQVTMFSKKGIRLYAVFANGSPWLHVSNRYWFTDNNKGRHAHCEFTFLLWLEEKEIPDFFKEINGIQSIDIEKWNLIHVAPYRYIQPENGSALKLVLIDDPKK
jgi:hypothetical protein